jgi:F-type H+-transporting ATPase subunit epsilon
MSLKDTIDFLKLEIVSAQSNLFSGEVKYVVVPGIDGELGVYPKHTPLITKIKPGALKFELAKEEGQEIFL